MVFDSTAGFYVQAPVPSQIRFWYKENSMHFFLPVYTTFE